jgi:GxxExxY protein
MMIEPDKEIDDLPIAVIGAAIEVHRILGPGYVESVYEEALAVELSLRKIPFERQKPIRVEYKGHLVSEGRLDLLVDNKLVVELKTVEALAPIHVAPVISYLKAMRLPLGLLINFNVPLLKRGLKRVVLTTNPSDVLAAQPRVQV